MVYYNSTGARLGVCYALLHLIGSITHPEKAGYREVIQGEDNKGHCHVTFNLEVPAHSHN